MKTEQEKEMAFIMKADRKETLRYLGYRGQDIDSQTERLLEEVFSELERDSSPKSIYQRYRCQATEDAVILKPFLEEISGSSSAVLQSDGSSQWEVILKSKNLAKNLRGCEQAVLLAATIGRAADMMIKKYSVSNLAKAAVVQAAGAAYIESYVDEIEDKVREKANRQGLYLRPRFSPGYGDFSIDYQKDFFELLECRRIGITLTEGNLMMPSKSVTAVIGLTSGKQESCWKRSCSQCEKTDCEFRKEESGE
jgi:cobalamin-dependent methionine synthase I